MIRGRTVIGGAAAAWLLSVMSAVSASAQSFVTYPAQVGTLGAIADGPSPTCGLASGMPRDVRFNVTGMPHVGAVQVGLTFSPPHTYLGDLIVTLVAPDGASHVLFGRVGAMTQSAPGGSADMAGPYLFTDGAVANLWTTAGTPRPAGPYHTSRIGGSAAGGTLTLMNPVFRGRVGNGTWTLRVVDTCSGDTGAVSAATLSLLPFVPTNLRVDTVAGQQVRLRWDAPPPFAPDGYIVDGGMVSGVPLASFATGTTAPVATFTAPIGSFWVRVRAIVNGVAGPPSEEAPLHVGVPVPPTTPASFMASVVGTTVHLAWKNQFGGGPPTGLVLGVTGSATGVFPLGVTEAASFAGVPGGTYHLTLLAANAGGGSAPIGPVTVTVPTACSGAPQTPANFLAYKTASGRVGLLWDPPLNGNAPTSYQLSVSGSFVGSFPVGGLGLETAAPAGSYTVAVAAVNPCGISAPTAGQTVTVP